MLGGIEVISRYLNHLIPYLLNSLEDPQVKKEKKKKHYYLYI
jgi:hypothetical protein